MVSLKIPQKNHNLIQKVTDVQRFKVWGKKFRGLLKDDWSMYYVWWEAEIAPNYCKAHAVYYPCMGPKYLQGTMLSSQSGSGYHCYDYLTTPWTILGYGRTPQWPRKGLWMFVKRSLVLLRCLSHPQHTQEPSGPPIQDTTCPLKVDCPTDDMSQN